MITYFNGKGSHCSLMAVGLLFGLFILPASSVAEHRPTSPLENRPFITVGSELDYPPYAFVNESGNADGYSVDLIKAAAKETGLILKFVTGPWNEVKGKLEQGEIDALPLVAYSTERDRYFDFSMMHTISHANIFIRKKDSSLYQSHEDLRNKEVIAMRGDSTHEYIKSNIISDKIILTPTVADALKMLSEGRHDFVIAPKLPALLLLKELEIDNVQPFGEPIDSYGKGYGFAVHKGDHELLDHLNRGLVLVRASGEYDRIYDKWFGHIDPRLDPNSHHQRQRIGNTYSHQFSLERHASSSGFS